ncbi:MAG TPA: MBL fold metallo-hydrolase [Clostridia bacterium]|nr:MBL fold metallo-hydrolase [Clostridia bacterium]
MRFCPLYSGSSGNVSFVEGGGVKLLVDAGLPGRKIAAALRARGVEPSDISGLLVTHDHSDHIAGVGVFARKYGVPVYANESTWAAMFPLIGKVPPQLMRAFETGRDFYIGGLNVYPFPTPHDAAESVGYSFSDGACKLTVMTDIGCFNDDLLAAAAGSALLLIESNHDVEMLKCGPYPYPLKRRILGAEGHLSNDCCAEALIRLYATGVRRAVLAHLSRDNNIEALALETVRQALRGADIPDGDFLLSLAHRDEVGEMIEI